MLKGQAMTQAAVDLARTGIRPTLIAEILNRKPTTISAALSHARAAGSDVPLFSPGKPSPKTADRTQARRDAMVDLVKAGHPPRQVAAMIGTTPASVSRKLYRMRLAGVDVPRSGRGRPGADVVSAP